MTVSYTREEVNRMNATARGANFANNAIVPAYVRTVAERGDKVLDFGAGKAHHAYDIEQATGAVVWEVDIGDNVREGMAYRYDEGTFDIAYASNVLNVQANQTQMLAVLVDLAGAIHPDGVVVFNYPHSPRHSPGTTIDHVLQLARVVFCFVQQLDNGVILAIEPINSN